VASGGKGNQINEEIGIGSLICQNRGQVKTVLGEAEDFFMKTHQNRWWLIPVITGGGNCDPQNPTAIMNWAKIYPKIIDKSGNPKYIVADVECGPNLIYEDTQSSLCFSHRLVREPGKGY
jgi:hypothetical protein